jgi:Tfp pilus assembly protein PilF
MWRVNRYRFARDLGAAAIVVAALTGCASTDRADPGLLPVRKEAARTSEETIRVLARGEAAVAAAAYDLAEADFRSIVEQEPSNARARLGLAEVHLANGRVDEARDDFAALTKVAEIRAVALQALGLALLAQQGKDSARTPLDLAVAADPSLWRAWNALGLYHASVGDWKKAETQYRKGLDANPRSATLNNNLGFTYLMRREYAKAADSFSRALALDPKLKQARGNLRLALAWQGRYIEALSGTAREDVPAALNDIGYVAMLRNDHAAAEAYFVRAMEASPSFHQAAAQNLEKLKSLTAAKDKPAPAKR